MRVNNNQSSPQFSGIYLKNTDFCEVRDIVMSLKLKGFHPLGHKEYYTQGGRYEIMQVVREVKRKGLYGDPKEFGAVIFPWRRAAYLVASRTDEAEMFPMVAKMKKNAILDMFV